MTTHEQKIEDLAALESGLAALEMDFVEDMAGRIAAGEELTENQETILDEIYLERRQ